MLPRTVVIVCAFEVGLVYVLVEALLPPVVELDFLIYTESDGNGFSLRVLLLASFDLDIDVPRLQLTVSADFIEPNSRICSQ